MFRNWYGSPLVGPCEASQISQTLQHKLVNRPKWAKKKEKKKEEEEVLARGGGSVTPRICFFFLVLKINKKN